MGCVPSTQARRKVGDRACLSAGSRRLGERETLGEAGSGEGTMLALGTQGAACGSLTVCLSFSRSCCWHLSASVSLCLRFSVSLFLSHSLPSFSVLAFLCLCLSLLFSLLLPHSVSLSPLFSLLSRGPSGCLEPQGQARVGRKPESAPRCHRALRSGLAKCRGQDTEAGEPTSSPGGESWAL